MKHSIDPQQNWLFDVGLGMFSDVARRRLTEDWPGVFRTCILELMPVDDVGARFSPDTGRPTKELYSACGLMLLMEYNNWTVEEAADAYMFDSRVQFALNLGHDLQSMSTRTVERYQSIFRSEDLAQNMMAEITARLIELLDVKIDKLRLDSTHVFSDMANFGRTHLLATVTRRFLVQVKRHTPNFFEALPEQLRERYAKKSWKFGEGFEGKLSGVDIAHDMSLLITEFNDNEQINTRKTFRDLVQVFSEQCEVIEDQIIIRKNPGCDVLQNPSDPDATYDMKKGAGYQVQTAETSSENNDCQLVVSVIAQTACEHDQHAVDKVLDDLEANDIKASSITADAGYGGDANYCTCRDREIDLIAPVLQGTQKKGRIELDAFVLDDNHCVVSCPEGESPTKAWFKAKEERGGAIFEGKHCGDCALVEHCQVRKKGKNYRMYYDVRMVRIAERKQALNTVEVAALYAKRSGIESTYSEAKRITGLDRLRVRGRPAVFHAIFLKLIGINIKRAAQSGKLSDLVKEKLADMQVIRFKRSKNRLWRAYFTFFTALCASTNQKIVDKDWNRFNRPATVLAM